MDDNKKIDTENLDTEVSVETENKEENEVVKPVSIPVVKQNRPGFFATQNQFNKGKFSNSGMNNRQRPGRAAARGR